MATRKPPSSGATKAEVNDAIAMLRADHKKVKDIFKKFENIKGRSDSAQKKRDLALQACNELKVHAQIEEEIFYPAVRKAIDDEDLMDEAQVEHAGATDLIEQIEAMEPGDDLFDAKVTVLGEHVEHHIKEEEGEMFPKVKKTKLDTAALGARMMKRKIALMEEMGLLEEADEGVAASRSRGRSR